jgi:hypothetical protein
MICHECQELLQRRLDGEAMDQAVVAEHLEKCAACRTLFAAAQRLVDGLQLSTAAVPPRLAERVVVRFARQRTARLRRRWAAVAIGVAASIVFAVLLLRNGLNRPADVPYVEQKDQEPPAKLVSVNQGEPPATAKEPALGETVQQGRAALERINREIWAKTREQADLWRDMTAPWETARLELAPKRTPRVDQAQPGPTTGWQTVANATRRGFSFMLQGAPPQPAKANAVTGDDLK